MKGKICILIALMILMAVPLLAKADSESDIRSCGNIIYKDGSDSIELYAADIVLLQEKLSSVPDSIFDPVLYSHMHEWEYININRNTHTRHCVGCGSSYDMISMHNAIKSKMCSITYDEKEYLGYEKICHCGYTWKEEIYHNLIYSPVDASYHTLFCALDGTGYCRGLAAQKSEHITSLHPAEKTSHRQVCDYCGFTGLIQGCVFDHDSIEDSENPTQVLKYCECGNYIIEPKETISDNSIGEGPDEESQTGALESISDNQVEVIEEGGQI